MLNGNGDEPGDDDKKRTRNSSTTLPWLTKKLKAGPTQEETSSSPFEEASLKVKSDADQPPTAELSNAIDLDGCRKTLADALRDLNRVCYDLQEEILADVPQTESLEQDLVEDELRISSSEFYGFDDSLVVPPIPISSDESEDDEANGQNLEEAQPDISEKTYNRVMPDHNNNPADINKPDAVQAMMATETGSIDLNIEADRRLLQKVTDLHPRVFLSKAKISKLIDFKILRLVGQGAFGSVYVVRKVGGFDAGRVYAMKVISKMVAIQTLNSAQHIKMERLILEAIQGTPFMVCLYYAFQTRQNLFLLMNFVQGGELYRRLMKLKVFPEAEACIYVAEVVVALGELHKRNILYRDLKLENILIDGEGHIVLADFGLTTLLTAERQYRAHTFCGTLEYMAPEVLRMSPDGYGKPADCWSLGVLTVELLTGISPFTRPNLPIDQQNTEIQRRILNEQPPIPMSFSPITTDLVLKLLDKDSSKRLDSSRIREHPFFKAIDWCKLSERRYRMPFLPPVNAADDVQHFDHEFTGQSIEVPLCEAPPNGFRLFRGYDYTAPQLLEWERMLQDEAVEYRNPAVENLPQCPNDLVLGSWVCSGGYGTCYRMEGNYLAKIIHLSVFRVSEIDALMSCSHQNIVQYHGSLRNGIEIWIITEYLSGLDLTMCIRNGHLNERFSRIIFLQLVRAVRHIHSLHFIHGDLKPENVVWKNERQMSVKLVDFGLASYNREFQQWKDKARYTLDYAPPELLTDDGFAIYSPAVDIYGLGATLYCMIVGHPPFRTSSEDMSQSPRTLRKIKHYIKRNTFNQVVSKWQNASQAFRDLVTWCLQKDPAARPKLKDMLNSEWLKTYADEEPEEDAEDEQ